MINLTNRVMEFSKNGVMEFSKNGGINFGNLQESYQVTVATRGRT